VHQEGTQVLLQRLALTCRAGCQFVTNLLGHVPNRHSHHACTIAASQFYCRHWVSVHAFGPRLSALHQFLLGAEDDDGVTPKSLGGLVRLLRRARPGCAIRFDSKTPSTMPDDPLFRV
jgi:hypothetical protein